MKKPAEMNVRCNRILKTSYLEAGVYPIPELQEGETFMVAGHAYWPDHDRSLHAGIIEPALATLKPNWVFLAGGMLHDEAFNELAPRRSRAKKRERTAVHHHPTTPEVQAALDEIVWENKVWMLGRLAGEYIASWAKPGNSKVLYFPSTSQLMPREYEALQHLYETQDYLYHFRDRHTHRVWIPSGTQVKDILGSDETTSSEDFAELLGIEDPRVQVCRFGAAARLSDLLIEISDFRRRNPVTAGYTQLKARMRSIIKSFDGKTSSGWETAPGKALPNTRRQYQFHEIGNLMDDERMGYLRKYDFWSKSLFFGRIVRGQVHGQSFPFLRGTDNRRCVVIEGHKFVEDTPGGLGRRELVTARDLTPAELKQYGK
jgi:hypothetical protein